MVKVYSLSIRNRAAAALVGLAILGVGAVFLTVGFALLLGLVAAGAVLGAGMAGYRLLRGQPAPRVGALHRSQLGADGNERRDPALDPALEVLPPQRAIVRPRGDTD